MPLQSRDTDMTLSFSISDMNLDLAFLAGLDAFKLLKLGVIALSPAWTGTTAAAA